MNLRILQTLSIALTTVLCGCAHEPSTQPVHASDSMAFDVIIAGGLVLDGSGRDAQSADVGIRGDRVAAVGDLSNATAGVRIQADGKRVTPGFINVLSWANETLLLDGRGLSDVVQGVTLEIFGEGSSPGPLSPAMKAELEASMTDEFRYPVPWTTLDEYLRHLERQGVSPNVASFVGAATIRQNVLGNAQRKASAEELKQMQMLTEQAMQEGALGVGSSLIYAPGAYADTEELTALAKVSAAFGGSYISHLRSEGNQFLEALDELIDITRRSGVHGEVYHLKAAGMANWPKMAQAIARIEAARAEGLSVAANMYVYTAGATGLDAAFPTWIQEGSYDDWRRRLMDPALRARVRLEMSDPNAGFENLRLAAGDPSNILLLGFKNKALRSLTGKTLKEACEFRRQAVEDCVIDLVIADGSRVEVAYFLMSEENVQLGLKQPWVSLGSDGAALAPEGVFLQQSTHPRAYGNFARFWQRYVVELKLMSEAEAVHRLTGLPATRLNIADRGCLRVGCFADIAVFDPQRLRASSTFIQPHQLSTGMAYVYVNGVAVVVDGLHTGAKPGRAVRRAANKR